MHSIAFLTLRRSNEEDVAIILNPTRLSNTETKRMTTFVLNLIPSSFLINFHHKGRRQQPEKKWHSSGSGLKKFYVDSQGNKRYPLRKN